MRKAFHGFKFHVLISFAVYNNLIYFSFKVKVLDDIYSDTSDEILYNSQMMMFFHLFQPIAAMRCNFFCRKPTFSQEPLTLHVTRYFIVCTCRVLDVQLSGPLYRVRRKTALSIQRGQDPATQQRLLFPVHQTNNETLSNNFL